jgi:hypothetical protein
MASAIPLQTASSRSSSVQPFAEAPGPRRAESSGPGTEGSLRPTQAEDRFIQARTSGSASPATEREPLLKPSRAGATKDALDSIAIGDSSAAQAEAPARKWAWSSGPGDAKANYNALVSAPQYASLSADLQKRVLQIYLRIPDSSERTDALVQLMKSGFMQQPEATKADILDVFANASADGQRYLVELMDRNVVGGQPPQARPALLDRDKDGGTLLENLHKIATGCVDPKLEQNNVFTGGLLGDILKEVARPGDVNQGLGMKTCTVTSMQYMLCRQNPAEYVRLMQGLVSPKGEASLRNGDTLTRVPDSIPVDKAFERSDSERIFQAAMMDYCDGSDVTYSDVADTHSDGATGLSGAQPYVGLRALFGPSGFEPVSIGQQDADQAKAGQVAPAQQEIFQKIKARAQDPRGVYVDMFWDRDKAGGHAIVVTAVKKDEKGQERVYFHNPQGYVPEGILYAYDPTRRIENGATGAESMLVKDFQAWTIAACLPK